MNNNTIIKSFMIDLYKCAEIKFFTSQIFTKSFIRISIYLNLDEFFIFVKNIIDELISHENLNSFMRIKSVEQSILLQIISELMDEKLKIKYAKFIYNLEKNIIFHKINYYKLSKFIFDENTPMLLIKILKYLFDRANKCIDKLGYVSISMLLGFYYIIPYILHNSDKKKLKLIKKFSTNFCSFRIQNSKIYDISNKTITFIDYLLKINNSHPQYTGILLMNLAQEQCHIYYIEHSELCKEFNILLNELKTFDNIEIKKNIRIIKKSMFLEKNKPRSTSQVKLNKKVKITYSLL